MDWVAECFPAVSTRQVVPWAGLRPVMPDLLPRVAQGRSPRVFYNTGHGHLGWTLSAITAQQIGDLVEESLDKSTAFAKVAAGGISAGLARPVIPTIPAADPLGSPL